MAKKQAKKKLPKASSQNSGKITVTRESGPHGWALPQFESSYSMLRLRTPKDETGPVLPQRSITKKKAPARGKGTFKSHYHPGKGEEIMHKASADFWVKRLQEYKLRKIASGANAARGMVQPGMPAIGGVNNWIPLGPTAVARGQAVGRPVIGGRTSGIAIANDGSCMYAATANGGVFKSVDWGVSWHSAMDSFDNNPTSFASASLVCGAIAVSPTDANRVYVGTGEGDTNQLFAGRLTNALPAYRGIGPIRSDNGGGNWILENSSPSLSGGAFFQIAVDPADQNNAVGATNNGLYQRVQSGTPTWTRRRTGIHSSVIVARTGGVTTFISAEWGVGIFSSGNGNTWAALGTGFPNSNVGRISLGIQPDNPNVIYAFVSNTSGGLRGLYRLDGLAGAWKTISGVTSPSNGNQLDYDLAIAVDPTNANNVYIGGDYFNISPYPGNIQRCVISPSGAAYSAVCTSIGTHAHADVHVLVFPHLDGTHLYTGCDGGIFLNSNPAGAGEFESRNTGLACLCTNYMGMSPSDPAVFYVGLQDNGTAKYSGEELFRHVNSGDGGYCVVHPTDIYQALVYANGKVYRTTNGGMDYGDFTQVISPPWSLMMEPLVGAPGNQRVAFGAGTQIYVSDNFGLTWPALASPSITLPAGATGIYSMVFASPTRLYIGTVNGRVFKANLAGGAWTATRIDNVAAGALPLTGMISDIAIDWSDATLNSVYIAYGGAGDARHVWRFNGTLWQSRSGTGANVLLDVEHNAILVDPVNTSNIYVGADIGVWSSTDGGINWITLENGLPDAPVFDLQLHESARLLRASLHGRGIWEFRLDPPVLGGVELYIRDTELDTARGENTDGRNNPSTFPATTVAHWRSPNIKVDAPTTLGYQTPTNQIDFVTFSEGITDGSHGVETIDPPAIVHNRVYVLVHNRGPLPTNTVLVTTAITNASTVLNQLPVGYDNSVRNGTAFPAGNWTSLGTVTINNLLPGFPQVAAFDLPSNLLPLPASLPGQSHFCIASFLHSTDDAYTNTQRNVDLLTVAERKAGQKNLHIIQFIGIPPPASHTTGVWARLQINGSLFKKAGLIDLEFNLKHYKGRLHFILPGELMNDAMLDNNKKYITKVKGGDLKIWLNKAFRDLEKVFWEGKFKKDDFESLQKAMKLVSTRPLLQPVGDRDGMCILKELPIKPDDVHTIFLRFDPPGKSRIGSNWTFDIIQRDSKTKKIQGGATYSLRVNKPGK